MIRAHSWFSKTNRREGSAAIEFALVGPLLILMIMGMALYGSWFWLAQSVQSLASESARAAIGGLDAAEQRRLAQDFIVAEAGSSGALDPSRLTVEVTADAQVIRVRLRFDATHHPIMALAAMMPAPPRIIERSAVVRVGGF